MNIPDFSQIEIKDYKPIIRELDNVIKTYCFENKESDAVFMKFIFHNAGTISQEKYFTAALTKTQLNKNTKKFSYKELAEEIDFYGLTFSPLTSNERTSLGFAFLGKDSEKVFPLLEQMILFPEFSQEPLQTTINNSRQEYLLKLQKTSFLAHKHFMAGLFGKDNPYGAYADVDDYGKINNNDLREFWQKRYSCNQCYIMLAGNINGQFLNLLNKYFGQTEWNKETADTSKKEIHIDFTPKNSVIVNRLPSAIQSSLVMGRLLPDVHHADYIPLTVLNCLFGGYFNSRLMSNIREEKGYTYGIDSALAPFKYGNILLIVTDVAQDKQEATIDEIKFEMKRLREELVSTEELSMVKNYITGDMLRSTDGVAEISENYEYFIRYNLREDYNSYMIKTIRETSSEQIRNLAQKYLNEEDFLISLVGK